MFAVNAGLERYTAGDCPRAVRVRFRVQPARRSSGYGELATDLERATRCIRGGHYSPEGPSGKRPPQP